MNLTKINIFPNRDHQRRSRKIEVKPPRLCRSPGKSASWIADPHPAFTHISPADLPVIGLLVTMEPFHVVNTPFVATVLPQSSIPYRICSAEEIEGLVHLAANGIGGRLLQYMDDPERNGHSIKPLMENQELGRNWLLDDAWNSIQWPGRLRQ
jgi:hypothetical protein